MTARRHIAVMLLVGGASLGSGCTQVPDADPAAGIPTVPSASPTAAGLAFTDVSAGSGIRHDVVSGGVEAKQFIIETTGVGVAVLDYDNDGVEDLYFANGSTVAELRRGTHPHGWLYRGNGDGTFRDVTEQARAAVPMWGFGAFAADYDNDGWTDLYLTALAANVLLRNRGDGTFEDVTRAAGIGDDRWSLGAAFADIDGDGHPDLYIANYLEFDIQNPPNGGKPCRVRDMGFEALCGPHGMPGSPDRFYRNLGDGTFADQTIAAGLGDGAALPGMAAVALHLDDDDKLDYYVANDSTANLLYMQTADAKFRDWSIASGAAFNGNGNPQATMGVACGDVDGDGDDDLFTTNFDLDVNTLHENLGGGLFADVTDRSGLGPPSFSKLGWSTGLHDLDNDGDLDIFTVNGHVYPEVQKVELLGNFAQPVQLFMNDGGGRFVEAPPAGDGYLGPGRGGVVLDLEGDGLLDLVVTNIAGPPAVFRNVTAGPGNWLSVELEGTHCARDPVGARLVMTVAGHEFRRSHVYTQGYLSTGSRRLHFGLGPTATADLTVRWPCGGEQSFAGLDANRGYRFREAATTAIKR